MIKLLLNFKYNSNQKIGLLILPNKFTVLAELLNTLTKFTEFSPLLLNISTLPCLQSNLNNKLCPVY